MRNTKNTTTPKAGLNFSNMQEEALETLNTANMSIMRLALAEADLKEAKNNLPASLQGKLTNDTDKKARREALKRETTAKAEALEKSNLICIAFMTRYMDMEDFKQGDIYHINMEGFLRKLGILEGKVDDLKKSHVKKVEAMTSRVIDRYTEEITRRKAGNAFLTTKEARTLRNTPQELILAFSEALVSSGCFEWSKGQLVRVDFTAKEAQEA